MTTQLRRRFNYDTSITTIRSRRLDYDDSTTTTRRPYILFWGSMSSHKCGGLGHSSAAVQPEASWPCQELPPQARYVTPVLLLHFDPPPPPPSQSRRKELNHTSPQVRAIMVPGLPASDHHVNCSESGWCDDHGGEAQVFPKKL